MKLTRIFSSMENLQQKFLIIFWFDWKYHSSKTFLILLESHIQYGCQGKLYFLNCWVFRKKNFWWEITGLVGLGWTKTMTTIPHLRSKMATLQDIVYHRTFWENVYKKLFFPETTYLIDPKLYRNYQWRFCTKLTFVFIGNPRWQPLQIFFFPHDRNSQWRSFTKLTFVFIGNPRWQPLQFFFLPFEMSSLCESMVFNHTQTMNFDCSSSFYSL